MGMASGAVQATISASTETTAGGAAAPGEKAVDDSNVARDQLIETIGKNVMAWAKWEGIDKTGQADAQIQPS